MCYVVCDFNATTSGTHFLSKFVVKVAEEGSDKEGAEASEVDFDADEVDIESDEEQEEDEEQTPAPADSAEAGEAAAETAAQEEQEARDREVLEAEMNTAAAAAEAAAHAAETEEARQERARQMQEAENNQERKEMWNDFIETMRDSLEELKNMPHARKLEPRSYRYVNYFRTLLKTELNRAPSCNKSVLNPTSFIQRTDSQKVFLTFHLPSIASGKTICKTLGC